MAFQFTLKELKNYITGRQKAKSLSKVLIFKNKQPDAKLLSIAEYERLLLFFEYLQRLEK